jgi:hypothetical protein
MYNKKQWAGREVEGRYSDLMTMFIRELEQNVNENSHGLCVDNLSDYPHYYFTIEYMRKCSENTQYIHTIRWILDSSNMAVTIEADKDTLERIPPDLVNRCHIIYRICDNALQVLKDTDTVSIDAGWYRCHMIAKMHMQETKPANYIHDFEILKTK